LSNTGAILGGGTALSSPSRAIDGTIYDTFRQRRT
jgi:hypothetical protein